MYVQEVDALVDSRVERRRGGLATREKYHEGEFVIVPNLGEILLFTFHECATASVKPHSTYMLVNPAGATI